MRNKQDLRSLIICCTPLQMLIAEKIIELNPNKKFDLIVTVPNDNDKFRYYYNKLKKKCFDCLYYIDKVGLKSFFKFIIDVKKNSLNKNYREIYLASIESRYFQYVISKNIHSDIFTFDDGTANIITSSRYHVNDKPHYFKRAFWRVIGINIYMEDIKAMSLLHYTIYENIPNIIDNTRFINLYKKGKDNNIQITKVVKIYLGQPLQDASSLFNDNYIVQTIESLSIDYYYPHPREKKIPIGSFKIIESFLVFEDYIIDYLKNNLEVEVEIYSFISGTILNIANLDRVSLKYIHNSYLYDNYKSFYNFVEKNFKIDCLSLDA